MRIIDIPQRTVNGSFSTSNVDIPVGAQTLTLTYTVPGWPSVSDGTATVELFFSRSSGPFIREWLDTFQHKTVTHRGETLTFLTAVVGMQVPFGASDRIRVDITTTVAFTSAVTVDAT